MAFMRVNLDISEVDIKNMLLADNNQKIIDQLKNSEKKKRSKEDFTILQ